MILSPIAGMEVMDVDRSFSPNTHVAHASISPLLSPISIPASPHSSPRRPLSPIQGASVQERGRGVPINAHPPDSSHPPDRPYVHVRGDPHDRSHPPDHPLNSLVPEGMMEEGGQRSVQNVLVSAQALERAMILNQHSSRRLAYLKVERHAWNTALEASEGYKMHCATIDWCQWSIYNQTLHREASRFE